MFVATEYSLEPTSLIQSRLGLAKQEDDSHVTVLVMTRKHGKTVSGVHFGADSHSTLCPLPIGEYIPINWGSELGVRVGVRGGSQRWKSELTRADQLTKRSSVTESSSVMLAKEALDDTVKDVLVSSAVTMP